MEILIHRWYNFPDDHSY